MWRMLIKLPIEEAREIARNWKEFAEELKYAPVKNGFVEIETPTQETRPVLLGDRLAAFLHALGFRQRPGCGCARRQMWLNRLGRKIGIGL